MTAVIDSPAWAPRSFSAALGTNEVRIWWVQLDELVGRVACFAPLLNQRERQRATRLRIKQHQERWIVSRALLRILTGAYSATPPHLVEFSYGPLGKPGLKPDQNGRELCFNNTDCDGAALFAFAYDRQLGIDMEHWPRRVRTERIVRRRFASDEAAPILNAPSLDEQNRRFLACWTRKEAWGKAIGVGIRYPMREISLCDNLPHVNKVIDHDGGQWSLFQLAPDRATIACLVASGLSDNIHCAALDANATTLLQLSETIE